MNNQAELISIGNELLSGRTLNTHGRDLGEALTAIGLLLVRDTTVPDGITSIGGAVQEALDRADLVFVSGGLGPTSDDITRDALGLMLAREIVPHQPTIEHLKGWFGSRGKPMSEAAERQALVLKDSKVLHNSVGAAPGQRIDLDPGKVLFVLPGPPREFNAILSEEIVPWLKERYAGARPRPVRVIHTKGIGESDIVTILERTSFEPEGIDLGFYPGGGKVEIRLTADPDNESALTKAENTLLEYLSGYLDPDR